MTEKKRNFVINDYGIHSQYGVFDVTAEPEMLVYVFTMEWVGAVIKWRDTKVHIIVDERWEAAECAAELAEDLARLETMPREEWGIDQKEVSRFLAAPCKAYEHVKVWRDHT